MLLHLHVKEVFLTIFTCRKWESLNSALYKVYNCTSLANEKYHQTESKEKQFDCNFQGRKKCFQARYTIEKSKDWWSLLKRNLNKIGLALEKIPSMEEVPPQYKLLTLVTLFALFTLLTMLSMLPLLTLLTLLTLLSLLHCLHYLQCLQCFHCFNTAKCVHSGIYAYMPNYCYMFGALRWWLYGRWSKNGSGVECRDGWIPLRLLRLLDHPRC